MKNKTLGRLLLVLLIGGMWFYLNLPAILARLILTPLPRPLWVSRVFRGASNPGELGLPYEHVTVLTSDGVLLQGWLILPDSVRLTVYYLHGHGDNRTQGLRRARWLYQHHYAALLMDLRAHGQSGGQVCTYGVLERGDVRQVIEQVAETHALRRWVLWGSSLGAAIALQAAGAHPDIRAVVAEAPFARLDQVLQRHVRFFFPGIGFPFQAETYARIEQRLGFPLPYDEPLRSAAKIRVPLLLVHGERDRRIPPRNSRLLAAATQPYSRILFLEAANHYNCWERGGKRYRKALLELLREAAQEEETGRMMLPGAKLPASPMPE